VVIIGMNTLNLQTVSNFHNYRITSAISMEKKKKPTTLAAMAIQAAICLGLDIREKYFKLTIESNQYLQTVIIRQKTIGNSGRYQGHREILFVHSWRISCHHSGFFHDQRDHAHVGQA
jgi:hypothetical protein